MVLPERLAVPIATAFGLGRAPLAPGTVGSLAALPLAWILATRGGGWTLLAGAVVVTVLGLATAGVAASSLGRPDPGPVVIDEVAGQLVALAFLPPDPAAFAVGFALFRVFDIWKPFPVRRLERLPGASGIMTDDLMAGLYANAVQQVLRQVAPGLW